MNQSGGVCVLYRSEFYGSPGAAEQLPQSEAVGIGQPTAGFNGLDGAAQGVALRRELDGVGIATVSVCFDKSCFGQHVQKRKQVFEFVRIIFRLVRAGIHLFKVTGGNINTRTKEAV